MNKRFERTDVATGADAQEAIIYNTGTLYGEWPDGRSFEGNRYVDRFVIRDGKIVRMDVWNDSAEILLTRTGLAEDGPIPALAHCGSGSASGKGN